MPEEAFGDASKSWELIITSHRWLHRFACDVATSEYPGGLRIQTMCEHFDEYFPQHYFSKSSLTAWQRFTRSFYSMCLGGSDVLIFFDFMALPQIGQTVDGEQIPRTEEEAELFFKALPSMGALYTMYPVIVLPEVTPSTHGYFESGWCYSEFCSSMLAMKLAEYSPRAIEMYLEHMQKARGGERDTDIQVVTDKVNAGTVTESVAQEYNNMFEKELCKKSFFAESDRDIVRGIVQGQLLQRLLFDAINRQDVVAVQYYLGEVLHKNLHASLDNPFNANMDTLLHLAVRVSSTEVVDELLRAGSRIDLQNLRGDTPVQFYGLPRLNSAARHLRRVSTTAYIAVEATEPVDDVVGSTLPLESPRSVSRPLGTRDLVPEACVLPN